jgi:hypothetical protein
MAICAEVRHNEYTLAELATEHGEDEEYIRRLLANNGITLVQSTRPVETRPATPAVANATPLAPRATPSVVTAPGVSSTPISQALKAARAILESVKGMPLDAKSQFLDLFEQCIIPVAGMAPEELHEMLQLVRQASGFYMGDDTA